KAQGQQAGKHDVAHKASGPCWGEPTILPRHRYSCRVRRIVAYVERTGEGDRARGSAARTQLRAQPSTLASRRIGGSPRIGPILADGCTSSSTSRSNTRAPLTSAFGPMVTRGGLGLLPQPQPQPDLFGFF